MKTRCPNCQTSFRVTPEQLKARVGKVRCGQCQSVFNALDSLLDETPVSASPRPSLAHPAPSAPQPPSGDFGRHAATSPAANADEFASGFPAASFAESATESATESTAEWTTESAAEAVAEPPADAAPQFTADFVPAGRAEPHIAPSVVDAAVADAPEFATQALSESEAQELGKASGLILPRETRAIPGYSKWVEGVMTGPLSLPAEKASRWPFVLAALLLVLALAGQLAFHFRSELAVAAPSLRPMLEALCQALDADIPLPRRVELVSIETSDLQSDPARANLLVLNATLRNRANHAQAYPSLELSLTDTQDVAIARRVFAPSEYLATTSAADSPFAANSDSIVRLWIEVREISAAGYRLYVFYP